MTKGSLWYKASRAGNSHARLKLNAAVEFKGDAGIHGRCVVGNRRHGRLDALPDEVHGIPRAPRPNHGGVERLIVRIIPGILLEVQGKILCVRGMCWTYVCGVWGGGRHDGGGRKKGRHGVEYDRCEKAWLVESWQRWAPFPRPTTHLEDGVGVVRHLERLCR